MPRLGTLLSGNETALFRPLVGVIAREIGRQRKRSLPPADVAGWTPETSVDEDSLGVDSLARLEIVAAVNKMFQLSRTGVEDYLLVHRSLAEWCEIIAAGYGHLPETEPERITFETSGSTGVPKVIEHNISDMIEEVSRHPDEFGPVSRVVTMVPSHHIYGFLFTVLSPLVNGWDVLDLSHKGPSAIARSGQAGDLVIGTPFTWDLVAKSGVQAPKGCTAVTSTAPAPPDLWPKLAAIGVDRLIEVYGATETLGIGTRAAPDAPFALMSHLLLEPHMDDGVAVARESGRRICPPDRISWAGPSTFHVLGRHDDAVQVGGINVFPDRVRSVLKATPGVADVAIRLDGSGASARLKAFIVPADITALNAPSALESKVRAHSAAHLSDPERPAAITLGHEVPRDGLGKLQDWAVQHR